MVTYHPTKLSDAAVCILLSKKITNEKGHVWGPYLVRCKRETTLIGLEPTRDEPNWFLINRLNHSATVSCVLTNAKLRYWIWIVMKVSTMYPENLQPNVIVSSNFWKNHKIRNPCQPSLYFTNCVFTATDWKLDLEMEWFASYIKPDSLSALFVRLDRRGVTPVHWIRRFSHHTKQ